MEVTFDESKTTALSIEAAIAKSGYDTEHKKGDDAAYKNLPGCCKYDHEMLMNQPAKDTH